MKAFWYLLSPKVKFEWTEELSRAFALAKQDIIRKLHEGVKMFEVGHKNCSCDGLVKTGAGAGSVTETLPVCRADHNSLLQGWLEDSIHVKSV